MEKRLCSTLVILMTSSVVWSGSIQEHILFCTKNLGDPSFYPSVSTPPISAGHTHRKQLDAYDRLDHGQHGSVVDLRHCFMAKASVEKKREGIVTLSRLQTQGFGQITNPQPGHRTGAVYQEGWQGNEVVGCVSVLSGDDGTDFYEVWVNVLKYMDAAAHQQDYSPTDYNCCTVAYAAAKHIEGNMASIDPTSFNLLGIGVVWRGSDLVTPEGLSNKVSVWTGKSYDFSTPESLKIPNSDSEVAEKNEL